MDKKEIKAQLALISGPSNVASHTGLLAERGFGPGCMPDAIVFPGNKSELQEIVKWASEKKVDIIPVGGGSQIKSVLSPFSGGIAISAGRLNRILELEPGNLSVRVEAGVLNRDLQRVLMPHNLHFPVIPFYECSTLGGETAADTATLKRSHGRAGDYILGLEFVTPAGNIVRTGGKTVKNASGYDFTRLLAGSWGTIGIITEIVIKLKPLVEDEYVALVEFNSVAEAAAVAGELLAQRMSAAWLGVLCGPAFSGIPGISSGAVLFVAFEGFRETVADHRHRLLGLVSGRRCREYTEKQEVLNFWEKFSALRRDSLTGASGTAVYDRRIQEVIISRALPFTGKWDTSICMDICSGLLDFSLNERTGHLPRRLTDYWLSLQEDLGRDKLYLSFAAPPARPLMDTLRKGIDPGGIMFPGNRLLRGESNG